MGFDIISSIMPPDLKNFYEEMSSNKMSNILASPHKFAVYFVPNMSLTSMASDPLLIMGGLGAVLGSANFNFGFMNKYVRSVSIPDLATSDGQFDKTEDVQTDFGYLAFPGRFMNPENNKFSITFMDTALSLCDSLFATWLAETTAQTWCINSSDADENKPYHTATFIIFQLQPAPAIAAAESGKNIGDAASIELPAAMYVFLRVFPSKVGMPKFDMNGDGSEVPTRDLEFTFSKMFVIPNFIGYLMDYVPSLGAATVQALAKGIASGSGSFGF